MNGGAASAAAHAWRAAGIASLAVAMAVGALVPISALGPRILDVDDVGWMLAGPLGPDPVQVWLGWTYFARSAWGFPPGINPEYGLELAGGIFYADPVPLLALPLKVVRDLAAVPQYSGPWLVCCGILQGAVAWRLVGLVNTDPVARSAGAALFTLQPMLINRMGGHFALAGQWTILLALLLSLRPSSRPRASLCWSALLVATSLIHAYLLAMVLALWLADLARRALAGASRAGLAVEVVFAPAAVTVALWAAGFFLLRGAIEPIGPRYGELGLDLLAPFDPVAWGRLLPALPGLRHWEHGGSYLGAGSLALLALALGSLIVLPIRRPPQTGPLAPLAITLAAMAAFAITHRPALGGVQVTLFEPPPLFLRLADLFRASERFVWPLAYALLLAAIAPLTQWLGERRAGLVLALLVGLQITDISVGIARLRSLVIEAPNPPAARLSDPFWQEATARYQRIRAAPAANMGEHWEPIARLAASQGLPTDAIYLSRVDPAAVLALRSRIAAELASGHHEPGTLYVLRDAETLALAIKGHDPARDLIARFDGIDVLAPGWFSAR